MTEQQVREIVRDELEKDKKYIFIANVLYLLIILYIVVRDTYF